MRAIEIFGITIINIIIVYSFSQHSSYTHALNVHHEVLQLSLQSGLGLLQSGDLGQGSLSGLLSLRQLALQLPLGFLQLLSACSALALELRAPLLGLAVGLGQLALQVRLAVLLFLQLFTQGVQIRGEVTHFAGQLLAGLSENKGTRYVLYAVNAMLCSAMRLCCPPVGKFQFWRVCRRTKGRDVIYMQYNVVRCNAAVGKFI